MRKSGGKAQSARVRYRTGARVRFNPKLSLWRAEGLYFPAPGALGTVVRLPKVGELGGAIVVKWDDGNQSEMAGRNAESLEWLV